MEAVGHGVEYVRAVMRVRSRKPRLLDGLIAVVAAWQQVQIWTTAHPGNRLALVPLELAFVAALLLRDRFPTGSRVGAFVALGAWAGFTPHGHSSSASFFVGAMLAFWIAGFTPDWRPALAGWSAGMPLMAYAESVFPGGSFGEFLFTALIQTGVWAGAFVLARRTRHAQVLEVDLVAAREEREERARRAVADERMRIARELHDVIAHNLTVAIIQMTAARGEIAAPDSHPSLARHLESADNSCRQALAEMRRLLGVLRPHDGKPGLAPVPGLASVSDLVDAVRNAGLPVEITVQGTPHQTTDGVDLAAYRIVQEALTNALKHSGGTPTTLMLHYQQDAIEIEVVNAGRLQPTDNGEGGRGLVGMRDRALLYGGTLDAGPNADGFRVAATLPLDREAQ